MLLSASFTFMDFDQSLDVTNYRKKYSNIDNSRFIYMQLYVFC